MHYVIGDVHGCYAEMMEMISKIKKKDKKALFIFLGHFLDRGPDVWKVLKWAKSHITPTGRYQSVRGNHEQGLINWYYKFYLRKNEPVDWDLFSEMCAYDFSDLLIKNRLKNSKKLKSYIHFLESLPYSKKMDIKTISGEKITYRIVHAWYNFKESEYSKKQHEINIWERACAGNYQNNEIIVHGHTPTISKKYMTSGIDNRPGMIGYKKNAINVDGGCCFRYKYTKFPCLLCAFCLETGEEYYSPDFETRFSSDNCKKLFLKKTKAGERKCKTVNSDLKELNKKKEAYERMYLASENNRYREELLDRIQTITIEI